jgi:hypothetical protein
VLAALTIARAADSVTVIAARDGFYRQLTVWGSPSVDHIANNTATAVAVAAIGAQASVGAGGTEGSASVDIAGFKFKNPSDMSDGANNTALAFYFGYLGVSGQWSNSSQTASVNGALAEIVASWESLFVYYNRDGTNGFQWNMNSDVFDCTKTNDCIDVNGVIDIKSTAFGGIITTKVNCPAGYNVNCTIYRFETSSTDGVLTFVLRLASEPVLINNVRVEPNYGKIDVVINFPWTRFPNLIDSANAKVGIVAYTAGRAGTASAAASRVNGNDAVTFTANDKSAYFSWDSQAILTSSAGATVYAHYISGASVEANQCNAATCGILTTIFVAGLKIRNAFLVALGWKTEMLIFTWNEVRPATLTWDPAIGITNTENAGAAVFVAPFVALIAVLATLF